MREWRIIISAAVVCLLSVGASASLINLQTAAIVDDLFASTAQPIGSVTTSSASAATLNVDLLSQAYTDGNTYAYLYQVSVLSDSDHPVEAFSVADFMDATSNVTMGYLTGDAPAGFLLADIDPESTGGFNGLGPILTFYYTSRFENEIPPANNSAVMYVLSDLSPDMILGNVINGTTGTASVVGPVPEPATMALLGLGAAALVSRRRRR